MGPQTFGLGLVSTSAIRRRRVFHCKCRYPHQDITTYTRFSKFGGILVIKQINDDTSPGLVCTNGNCTIPGELIFRYVITLREIDTASESLL